MPKNKPPQKPVRKIPKNFRLFAEDVRRLKLGAEKMGVPAAIYLQFALREKFVRDGIEVGASRDQAKRERRAARGQIKEELGKD